MRDNQNILRPRHTRPEEEPIAALPGLLINPAGDIDPEHEALLAEGVGLALFAVLDKLTPSELLALVLHDVFAVPFDNIAPIVDRSAEATRKLASPQTAHRHQETAARPDLSADVP
jgi:DNA-directed RNA polymerase specialized sigma24 family protein